MHATAGPARSKGHPPGATSDGNMMTGRRTTVKADYTVLLMMEETAIGYVRPRKRIKAQGSIDDGKEYSDDDGKLRDYGTSGGIEMGIGYSSAGTFHSFPTPMSTPAGGR